MAYGHWLKYLTNKSPREMQGTWPQGYYCLKIYIMNNNNNNSTFSRILNTRIDPILLRIFFKSI